MLRLIHLCFFLGVSLPLIANAWQGSDCPRANSTNIIFPSSEFDIWNTPSDLPIVVSINGKSISVKSNQLIRIPSSKFSAEYLGNGITGSYQVLSADKKTVYATGIINLLNGDYNDGNSCTDVNTPSDYKCVMWSGTCCMYDSPGGDYTGTRVMVSFGTNY